MIDTASVILLTGFPGSGKSLRLVEFMLEAQGRGELVYWCNINGLRIPGVQEFPDPRNWQELPGGSVLVVDEAQEFFPMRKSGDPPDYIRAMSRVRHQGIRIVLATQNPIYLDVYIRRLVGRHEHLLREDGKSSATLFAFNGVMDDASSNKKLAKAGGVDVQVYQYKQELFPLYDSAEVHTVKYAMPKRLRKSYLMLAAAIVAFAGVFLYVRHLTHSNAASSTTSEGAALAAAAQPASLGGTGDVQKPKYASTADYVAAQVPRMGARPWSAPIYDAQAPTTHPDLLCMASGVGKGSTCHCYTEQATPYSGLTDEQCRLFAHDGVYNPYRPTSQPVSHFGESSGFDSVNNGGSRSQSIAYQSRPSHDWLPAPYGYKPMGYSDQPASSSSVRR